MGKKFFTLLFVVLITITSICFASQEVIEVKLNDKYIDFTDSEGNRVDPELINNRTMVPMRKIFETFGASVEWDGATQKVTAKTAEKEIVLQINNSEAKLINVATGEAKIIKLDSAPVILDSRTMVPVRFIAESLEKQVGWDAKERVVVIIDYDKIIKDLATDCATFIEMLKEQTTEIKTFDVTTTIKGTLNYKDEESKKNNESLTINGDVNTKKSDDKLSIELNLKLAGKGQLGTSIKENEYNNIKIGAIFDLTNGDIYTHSSLNDNNKWIKNSLNDSNSIMQLFNNKLDVQKMLAVDEDSIMKDTYEQIAKKIDTIKSLIGNDKIKVTGKSTKTYTMKWGLDEFLSQLNLENDDLIDELLSLGKATVELSNVYKKGILSKSKVDIDISLQMKDSDEKLTGNVTIESKYKSYNKDVKIALPKI